MNRLPKDDEPAPRRPAIERRIVRDLPPGEMPKLTAERLVKLVRQTFREGKKLAPNMNVFAISVEGAGFKTTYGCPVSASVGSVPALAHAMLQLLKTNGIDEKSDPRLWVARQALTDFVMDVERSRR